MDVRVRSHALLVAALLLVAAEASAECDSDLETCGKRAFQAGIAAFQDENYELALKHFQQAQEYRPHPVVLFNVALAEAKVGRITAALTHLDQVYDDPRTPETLLGKVRSERQQTAQKLAMVALDQAGAELYLDGELATGDPPAAQVDPGTHGVRVLVDGEVVVDRTLSLEAGEKVRLTVAKVAEPGSPTIVPSPPALPPLPPPPDERSKLSPPWVYGGAGLTLLLTGVTVWSGLDTRHAFRAYEDDFSRLTPQERRSRVDQGEGKQLRTNVLVGATAAVGVATAITGVFLVDWSDQQRTSLAIGPSRVVFQQRF